MKGADALLIAIPAGTILALAILGGLFLYFSWKENRDRGKK